MRSIIIILVLSQFSLKFPTSVDGTQLTLHRSVYKFIAFTMSLSLIILFEVKRIIKFNSRKLKEAVK